jgi:hypothetical protein
MTVEIDAAAPPIRIEIIRFANRLTRPGRAAGFP